jgi:DNA repair protein RecN (Recombination protein N)
MLVTLGIRNFVLIEDASLEFGPGLTALTGETGAGKTLLTQALGLMLGERAGEGLVGGAGEEALLQAVFDLGDCEARNVPPELVELAGVEAGELIASRRLHRSGRNRCYLNGAAVSLSALGDALGGLVAFSGQHEHRRLLEPGYQRLVLDAFAGEAVVAPAAGYREAWTEAREAEARLAEGRKGREERRKEAELLRFQVQELRQAGLNVDEEQELLVEQRILARAEDLLAVTGEAADLLRGDGDRADVGGLLGLARSRLGGLQGVDPALDGLLGQLTEAGYLLDDVASGLRSYSGRVSVDPARLRTVDERLRVYTDISKKYGGTTGAAVGYLSTGEERLAELDGMEEDLEGLQAGREAAVARSLELAAALTAERRRAAPVLEGAVEEQLADLGMPHTRLLVDVTSRPGWEGLAEHGADLVEFQLVSNPGQPPRPLSRVASGGELSRTLLAIKSALAGLEGAETLVFDEIDAGIGGRTALAVGAKLRELSRDNQVVVVTHLPQVAAFADHHFLIDKAVTAGEHTVTRLVRLDGEASLAELCRMMGGSPDEPGALAHARNLKDRAASGLID